MTEKSAFPIVATPSSMTNDTGMTLRDWFAGQAIVGILARGGDGIPIRIATRAYELADFLLEVREE